MLLDHPFGRGGVLRQFFLRPAGSLQQLAAAIRAAALQHIRGAGAAESALE